MRNLREKKKCSYVCENVIKTEMAGIKLSSRDNMKSAEWIGLAYNDTSAASIKSMIAKIGPDALVKTFVFI